MVSGLFGYAPCTSQRAEASEDTEERVCVASNGWILEHLPSMLILDTELCRYAPLKRL